MRTETKRQPQVGPSGVGRTKIFDALCMSSYDLESPTSIYFEITNNFLQLSEFTNTESISNKNYLHVKKLVTAMPPWQGTDWLGDRDGRKTYFFTTYILNLLLWCVCVCVCLKM